MSTGSVPTVAHDCKLLAALSALKKVNISGQTFAGSKTKPKQLLWGVCDGRRTHSHKDPTKCLKLGIDAGREVVKAFGFISKIASQITDSAEAGAFELLLHLFYYSHLDGKNCSHRFHIPLYRNRKPLIRF